MFFFVYLSIALEFQILDDNPMNPSPTPVPISVHIELMKTSITNINDENKCHTNYACTTTDINPECGKRCWSNLGNDYFEYTFRGEQFQVYGTKASNQGNFSLYLDGSVIETINLYAPTTIERTLVYTSERLSYGDHTIRAEGIPGQLFEIYKFAYWPSVEATRINISEMTTISGSWTAESDKIGGTREYSNSNGASKSSVFVGSKVWVYGSKDGGHGTMSVQFATENAEVNEEATPRVDAALVYESETHPFKQYELLIERTGSKAILIYCVYYLSNAPKQTPAPYPTRTIVPNTAATFIDKTFTNTLPNDNQQILIQSSSKVKQISGCKFTDINGNFNYFIRPETEIQFYDNIIEYSDITQTYAAPIWANYDGHFMMSDCRFINARCSKVVGGDANVFSCTRSMNLEIESCQFINCGNANGQNIIKLNNARSSLRMNSCSFTFDDVSKSCQAVYISTSNVMINECTFTRCGKDTINIASQSNNGIFQFTNNQVEGLKDQFILANSMKTKPIISNNTFQNINLEGKYLITYNHNQDEIELYNNTFKKISVSGNEAYGGSCELWFAREGKIDYSIIFSQCKFYELSNSHSDSPYNQGGAIHYGYTLSTSNVSIHFEQSEFKNNRCNNGQGGAIGINIKGNLYINKCLFEDNEASSKGGAIYIWCKVVDPNTPTVDEPILMENIIITNCQFINNKGSEGQAIYIEEENIEDIKLEISNCTFNNNGEDQSKHMIVNYCHEMIFEHNTVEYSDPSKTSGILSLNNANIITINDCNFSECTTTSEGSIKFSGQTDSSNTIITQCRFDNCRSSSYTINIEKGTTEAESVIVSFSTTTNSNGGINFGNKGFTLRNSQIIRTKATGGIKIAQTSDKTDPIIVTNCVFDNCEEGNQRCFSLTVFTTSFVFANNTIQNMIERGKSGYIGFINFNNELNTCTIENLTLQNNRCNSDYGGGTGLWINNVGKIIFNKCSFINNTALTSSESRSQKPTGQNAYYAGDGGGIQYGFTRSLCNIDLIFNECLFRENKAVRHGGALAVQMNKIVEINKCTFEWNIANYQTTTSSELLYDNHFNKKTEGRGGAIYLNPSYTSNDGTFYTKSIKIEDCIFRKNTAFDGHAIYIEGDQCDTEFIINNNDFIDNYDSETYSINKAVIVSEIIDLYENKIILSNRFSYNDTEIFVPSLKYVDHYGNAPTSTPQPTPTPTPVPISVHIELMKTSITNINDENKCHTNYACTTTDINPECGKRCWSNLGNDYFEYTFRGEQFQVYGTKASNQGNFSLYLDGSVIETINLYAPTTIERTLVYTSERLSYGDHTIRAEGIPGQLFEIYKFAYWPSVEATRINVSEMTTISGSWTAESDKIGGTREYSNSNGASKSSVFVGSKVWVYGSKDGGHGTMSVQFATENAEVNEEATPRVDAALVYESETHPFKQYELLIERTGSKAILIYCVYYLSNAPKQTPAPYPTRTIVPNTAATFIDKTFTNTLPNDNQQILIQSSSKVKQISGCKFTDINGNFNYFIRPEIEIQFFNNIIEYSDITQTYAAPIWANYDGHFMMSDCRFINARCSKVVGGDANVFSCTRSMNLEIESCQFINCGNANGQNIIKLNNARSSLRMNSCSFTFDDVSKSCQVVYISTSNVMINECTFTRCGKDTINIASQSNNGIFQFTNNQVEGLKDQFILANSMKTKPIISNNTFQNINLEGKYLITYNHNQDEIELYNNTFKKISVSGNEAYGGSCELWFAREGKIDYSIIFSQCKFYELSNSHSDSPYNQGGAIHYGYTLSTSNVSIHFEQSEFKNNRCNNGQGGAIGINIKGNLYINKCLFEDNEASSKGGAIYIWCKVVDPNTPTVDEPILMENIIITNCQFINNKGSEGQAIYIEEENIEDIKLEISNCTFNNNGEDQSKHMIVNYCHEMIFEHNTVEYSDPSKTSGILSLNNANIITINDCNFSECTTTSEGSIKFSGQTDSSNTIITQCRFDNCRSSSYTINIEKGTTEAESVIVSFSTTTNSNGGINFGNKGFTLRNSQIIRTKATGGIKIAQTSDKTDPIIVTNCVFDNCEEGNQRCFSLTVFTTSFVFANNTIQNMIERGKSGYIGFINFNNELNTCTIENLTLQNNRCNSDYGGGTGLWINNVGKIIFNKCSFINNTALTSSESRSQKPTGQNAYYAGDGGGIQYGFTRSLCNIDLIFNECLFRENKAVRHGGALAVQMNKIVEINKCTFEWNIANYQTTTSSELLYDNHFNKKTEGRGGAIYLNPSYTSNDGTFYTKSIKIEDCIFRKNTAFDGHAIYIEGDQCDTEFIINNNDFIDNYDSETYSINKAVIVSEIIDLYENKIILSNRFSYNDTEIFVPSLKYVDHYGNAPTSTPQPTPTPTPVPISVHIELMKTSITNTNDENKCHTNYACTTTDINPECGKRCWSNLGNDYFEYTFRGEQFQVYGTKASNQGNFSLYLDGSVIETINLYAPTTIERTLVYTSERLSYGDHTIRAEGIPGQLFEIYKFAYWPSVEATRINVSEMTTISGSWTAESDKIGGTREYSNSNGASKSSVFVGSKVWVYGSKDGGHGTMSVQFATENAEVNEEATPRVDAALVYESETHPFKQYELLIERTGSKAILIYCVYYLSNAPKQTPAPYPTRTIVPNTAATFIDKTFTNTLPNDNQQILIQSSSKVKQISGCKFTDINGNFNYFIRPEIEIQFFNNIIEYSDITQTYAAPIWANYDGHFMMSDCRFINARCSKVVGGDANVFSCTRSMNLEIESCQFINCGNANGQNIIKLNNARSSLRMNSCSFTFDDVSKSCQAVYISTSNVMINECTFTRCGKDTINIASQSNNGIFQFTNNQVEGLKDQFILANSMKTKPIISNNTFQNINLEGKYLITYNHNQDEIELYNNTFKKISVSGNEAYGGSCELWFAREGKIDYSIIFSQCKFYELSNSHSDSPYNQGGAIHYGYTLSTSNVSIHFEQSEFKNNRCNNGQGGAIGINIKGNLYINKCLFEDNEASSKGGAIYIWCKVVDPNTPTVDEPILMENIIITNCQFINNKGSEGQAIYIEEENIEDIKLEISNCTFNNNGEDQSKHMIVNYCHEMIFEHNTVEYSDPSKTSGILSLNNANIITINDCNFSECTTTSEGSIKFSGQTDSSNTIITRCRFDNCRSSSYTINIEKGTTEAESVIVSFSTTTNSNGGINFGNKGFTLRNSQIIRTKATGGIKIAQTSDKTDPIIVTNCVFDNCEEGNQRCFSLTVFTTSFVFANNTIQNMIERGKSGYIGFINFNNELNTCTIENLTLQNNRCNSDYGGGTGLWINNVGKIIFNKCSFINNTALTSSESRSQKPTGQNAYYAGDGGGIQYGFTKSLCNIDLIFNECLFRENKAVRHGGALAVQMNKIVEINKCTFEWNIANYQTTTSSELLYDNHFNKKTEGRGGAIYLNPSYTSNDGTFYTKSIKIEDCIFRKNTAFDGHAIYIEGDQCESQITISNNEFINNYDKNKDISLQSVIASEIQNILTDEVVEMNKFSYSLREYKIAPFVYVDHYGIVIPSTPSPTNPPTNGNVSDNTASGNNNVMKFNCPIASGYVKIYVTCTTCSIKEQIWFKVLFSNNDISGVEYDPRTIYNDATIEFFVPLSKMSYNDETFTLSYVLQSSDIKYTQGSAETNLKCVPIATQTPPPSRSPRPTKTPSMTPTPEPTPEIIYLNKNNCSEGVRCEEIVTENTVVHVFIDVTSFNNFDQGNDDGGAVHLIDCCLTCDDTQFTNCQSKQGGGGAIFIENTLRFTNNITLTALRFDNCKAKYGGAIFIYCGTTKAPVSILSCNFNNNELFANDETNNLHIGGKSILIAAKKGSVSYCRFSGNQGEGEQMKFVNRFDEDDYIFNRKSHKSLSIKSYKEYYHETFSVSNCIFDIDKDSKSSISYIAGKSGTKFEIKDCIFTGTLSEDAHFINEEINSNESPKVLVKSCKFSSDSVHSLKLDESNSHAGNTFNYVYSERNDEKERNAYSWKLIAGIVVSAFAVMVVAIAASIFYCRENDDGIIRNSKESGEIQPDL